MESSFAERACGSKGLAHAILPESTIRPPRPKSPSLRLRFSAGVTPRATGASLGVTARVPGFGDARVNSASTNAAKARALALGMRPVG